MKKIVIIVIVLALIGGAGAYVLKKRGASKSEAGVGAPQAVATATVEKGDIRLAVASTGRVVSKLDVDIKCQASGEVIALPFDVSDSVEKGTLLVEIDPEDEARNVRMAEVALSSSEARLKQAREQLRTDELSIAESRRSAEADLKSVQVSLADKERQFRRMKNLFATKTVGEEEYEEAKTAADLAQVDIEKAKVQIQEIDVKKEALAVQRQSVALAEAQVESDKIALDQARERLNDTKVYAPFAGTVATRDVQVGQIVVSPTNNVSGGTSLMTLSDLSSLYVIAAVDESDIGKVEVGQPVSITVDAFPQMRFRGEVVRIATRGEIESNVVTFDVKIEVKSRNKEKLKPEMTANVEIVAGDKQGVLLLPSDAVSRFRGKAFVQIPTAEPGAKPERKEVETGLDDGVQVEIVSGLAEGDQVVAGGRSRGRWSRSGAGGDAGQQAREARMRTGMMMRAARGRRR